MNRSSLILSLLAGLLVGCSTVPANAAVQDSIQTFMVALYSGDAEAYAKAILPCPDSQVLIGDHSVSAEERAAVQREIAEARFEPVGPCQYLGKAVKPRRNGDFPVGTTVTFTTQLRGTILMIPVVNTEQGWKVDVRYWIAMQKEYKESDPEVAVRQFLYALIAREKADLAAVTPAGSDLRSLLKGHPPFEDQYYALAMEMPVVQAMPGESMPVPGGRTLRAGVSSDEHKWFVGLYGPYQLVFELKKEASGWKTVPRDYRSLIGVDP